MKQNTAAAVVQRAARPSSADWQAYGAHVNPVLDQFLVLTGRNQHFVHAQGNRLTAADGHIYLDWIAGFGSLNLGHHPEVALQAVREFAASDAPSLYVESVNPYAGALAKALVSAAGAEFETCFFSNSGTEAVEAAIKLALAVTARPVAVYCTGAYHGTTLGSLAMMAPGAFRDPFEAALCQWRAVPYNDAAALEAACQAGDVCAVVMELVQVESGVHGASHEFLQSARAVCDRTGALLIFDEVQTGMGRTGTLFGFQRTPVVPDVMALAKGLGAGVVPIGATLMRRGLFQAAYSGYDRAEAHHSTYGGNTLACRVALAVLKAMGNPDFLAAVAERGEQLQRLAQARLGAHPMVRRLSFYGLLGAIEINEVAHPWFDWEAMGLDNWAHKPAAGALLMHRLHRRRHLMQLCGHDWRCLRIEPPLTVSLADCESLIDDLGTELDWMWSHA